MRIFCFARPCSVHYFENEASRKNEYNKQLSTYFGKCLSFDRNRQLIPVPGRHVGEALFSLINNALLPFFPPSFCCQVNTDRRDCHNYLTLQLVDSPSVFSYHVQEILTLLYFIHL